MTSNFHRSGDGDKLHLPRARDPSDSEDVRE